MSNECVRDTEVLRNAIVRFGNDSQVDMVIEEMSELTKALLKARRAGIKQYNTPSVLEEFVDVEICLDQLKLILVNGADVAHLNNLLCMYRSDKIRRLHKSISENGRAAEKNV